MANFAITPTDTTFTIDVGDDTVAAAASASQAELSAAAAEAIARPIQLNNAAGLAATNEGEFFFVDQGDGTADLYRHDAGPTATAMGRTTIIDPQGSGAAGLIGKAGGGTVQDFITAAPSTTTPVLSAAEARAGYQTDSLAEMHFGVLRGTGWNSTVPEAGGLLSRPNQSNRAAGEYALTLTTAGSFYANMLITYLGNDGQYYSNVIKSISGSTLNLAAPLEVAVDAGNHVGNFYNDQAHPNQNGYYAIADYILRTRDFARQAAWVWAGPQSGRYYKLSTPTISSLTALNYANPGSTTIGALKAVTSATLQGIVTPDITLPSGVYEAVFTITPNTEAGSADTDTTRCEVLESGATIGFQDSSVRHPTELRVRFSTLSDSKVALRVRSVSSGIGFAVSSMRIERIIGRLPVLDRQKIVCLGDSWFGQNHLFDRLVARLPNATIVNAGVGGNTTAQMVARYAGDVADENPDIVIVVGGTNDYYGAVTASAHWANISSLKRLGANANAETIIVSSSVGTDAHTTLGDGLTLSRNYVTQNKYLSQAQEVKTETVTQYFPINVEIANGATVTILQLPGTTRFGLNIDRVYLKGLTGNVTFGFGTDIDNVTQDTGTFAFASILSNVAAPKVANDAARWFAFRATNSSGSDVRVTGYAQITWTPVI